MVDTLFEISWEVCNKVGGIHTVISSKVPFIRPHCADYICIGPSLGQDFEQRPAPQRWREVFAALEARGIACRYGVWPIPGEPTAILIDAGKLLEERNRIKHLLWERHGIDSLNAAWDFDEPMCFATAAGMLVEEYVRRFPGKAVAHCHEWMAGFAILHLKDCGAAVATVFTTHATMLGRSIAGSGHALYELIESIDPREWAYRLGVAEKHLAEVACARAADVFTTVSEITGMEAERLLGRKPDVLLFNGFHTDRFPTFEETSLMHLRSREVLRELASHVLFPHYTFDLEKTMLFYTSGRYEFQNKGMDILIESLGRLNHALSGTDRTVIVFFWIIMGRHGIRAEIAESRDFYHYLKSHVEWHSKPLLRRIVLDLLSGHKPGAGDVFTSRFLEELRSGIRPLAREGTPALSTHEVHGGDSDAILSACRQAGLLNRKEDRVKVILYPGYLTGSDGLLNLSYYEAISGTHLGIFASSYEPWGYTPLESAALGVPAITTDLAGFGRHIDGERTTDKGIIVLKRLRRPREDVVAELAKSLQDFSELSHADRVLHGFAAKEFASACDWSVFIGQYREAYAKALERH